MIAAMSLELPVAQPMGAHPMGAHPPGVVVERAHAARQPPRLLEAAQQLGGERGNAHLSMDDVTVS